MNYQQHAARSAWLVLALVGCSSSTSKTNYDDLRREAAQRQAGYPSPPSAEDPRAWSTLLADGGDAINNGKGLPPAAGGSLGAGGNLGAGGGLGAGGFGNGGTSPEAGTESPAADFALANYATLSPTPSGFVPVGESDTSASVTSLSPSTLVYRPGTLTAIQVSYSSVFDDVDALSLQFGSGSPIRIPDSGKGVSEIDVTPTNETCFQAGTGCFPVTTTVGALTSQSPSGESPTATRSVPGVLVCGGCSSPNCTALDPTCVGVVERGTPIDCGTPQTTSTSVTDIVSMGSTSGTVSIALVTQGTTARIQLTNQGSSVYDTGCISSPTGTPIGFSYSTATSQLQMTVSVNCNGGASGSVYYEVTCPAAAAPAQ